MEVKQNVNLHNRFDIEVRNIETDEIKKYTAFNIVLNQMWERLCAGNNYFSYIHFGTGTGTPIASRTSLFAHLGTKSAVDEELIKAIPISKWKRKIVLNPEEYVGSTITEVGVSFGSGTTNLVTHAMLKDAEGNQISITKSNTDIVTIYATVFITFGNQYENLKYINLPSNNTLINYLIGGDSAPSGSFGLNEIINSYQRLGSISLATWTSDVANKKRKTNVNRFGITDGNGNAQVLDFTNLFTLKLPQAGIFSGQSYTDVSVGVGNGIKKEFLLPSANIKQSSIFIKEDGVPNNAISITKKYKNATRMANPSSLSTGMGYGVALAHDGNIMALAHYYSPYITTYDWVDSSWVKRPNPSSLPTGISNGVALAHDGNIMVVAHDSSPYITTYKHLPMANIIFDTPPASGKVITADYTVDGIHKTDQYVVDVSFAIQFGEGV